MPTIRRFDDLECWQEARRLARRVYELTKRSEFRKDLELVSQIRRSSVSSMANIAEGFHRSTRKDFLRFLDYSRSSIAETISHCYVALDQKYITDDEMAEIRRQSDLAWKKVNAFVAYLKKVEF